MTTKIALIVWILILGSGMFGIYLAIGNSEVFQSEYDAIQSKVAMSHDEDFKAFVLSKMADGKIIVFERDEIYSKYDDLMKKRTSNSRIEQFKAIPTSMNAEAK